MLGLLKCKPSSSSLDDSDSPPLKKCKILCDADQDFQSHSIVDAESLSFASTQPDVQKSAAFITGEQSDNNKDVRFSSMYTQFF